MEGELKMAKCTRCGNEGPLVPKSISSRELSRLVERLAEEGRIIWDSGYCEDCDELVVPERGKCSVCGRECELASRLEVKEALEDYENDICKQCLDIEWFDRAYDSHLADMAEGF